VLNPPVVSRTAAEKVRCAPEALVVLGVLCEPVRVSRALQSEVSARERAGHSNVHSQTLGVLPARDGDVSRTAPRSLAEQETLLKHWRQETLLSKPVNEVAKPVVAHDDVTVPLAASGMVAVNVKGLHAKGTSDIRARHLETQAVSHSCAEHLGGQATVRPIEVRWDRCHPCPGVFCQQPCEPLRLQKRRGLAHQPGVGSFVDSEGGLSLRPTVCVSLWRSSPGLSRGTLGFPPTCGESTVSELSDPTQPKTTKRRSKTGLGVRPIVKNYAKDGFSSLPDTLIELNGMCLPVNQGSGAHEVRGPQNTTDEMRRRNKAD